MSEIYLGRLNRKPSEARLSVIGFGNNACVLLKAGAYDLRLGGNRHTLAAELERLALEIRGHTVESGIIQGHAEPERVEFRRRVTLEDIPVGDPARAWPLIVERFPELADCVPTQYQKHIKHLVLPAGPSEVEQDLETLRPRVEDLVNGSGRVVKSWVAEALGLPAGGSSWSRVQAAAEALQNEVENQEAVQNSSSTVAEPGEAGQKVA